LSKIDRNILIVAYYFPPVGMGGVQRAAKTAKYLAGDGWRVTVLTSDYKDYSLLDNSLLDDLDDNIEVITISDPVIGLIKHKHSSNSIIKTHNDLARQLVRLPDIKVFWSSKAFRAVEKIVDQKHINYILTTSPAPSVHKIGIRLKQKYNLKWLADFRDPWFADDLSPLTPVHKFVRDNLEMDVMKYADAITVVTSTHLNDLRQRYPKHKERIYFVPNGYDPEDFAGLQNTFPDKLIITHCGTLCSNFSVKAFFEALVAVIKNDKILKQKIVFHQIGAVHDDIHKMLKAKYSPQLNIGFLGYMEHRKALREMAKSSAIVVFSGTLPGKELNVPGKLYEGLAISKPFLGVFRNESPGVEIISDMDGCYHLNPDDLKSMTSGLQKLIDLYKSGNLHSVSREDDLEIYSRQFQAQTIARLLEG
jgi:glycosyltransferase involved in cell wall biosynthesis